MQHKSPPCCCSTICNILQGFDAFHVQLQEPEDPLAAALQRNTQMLQGREGKEEEEGPFLHPAPGTGGAGCRSWCPAR